MTEQASRDQLTKRPSRRLTERTPRKLRAIVIDDDKRTIESLQGRDTLIDLKIIDGYIAAQKLLLQYSNSGDRGGDVFLIDIDFAKSTLPHNLEWGNSGALKPFGPLLALPFLGREVCVFVPYSTYWNDEHIYLNGFVLVATSLILAASEQKAIRLNDVRREIDESEGEISFSSTVGFALSDALAKYRSVLAQRETIQLLDVARTKRRLEKLVKRVEISGEQMGLPLRDESGVLSIGFSHRPFHLESIELSSLFADLLNFNVPNTDNMRQIIGVLEHWIPRSLESGGYALPEAATELLKLTEGLSEDDDDKQKPFKNALRIIMQRSPQLNKFAVKRIAIVFAWVQAWWFKRCVEENFHSDIEEGDAPLITRVHNILALKKDSSTVYKRLLADDGGKKISNRQWRKPFKLKGTYNGVNDAYQLNKDEPSALTDYERSLCIQYANEILGWNGLENSYPRWMVE